MIKENVIEKFISLDGTVRVSAVICTSLIEEARSIHNSFPVASAALGRALTGAALLASFMKEDARLTLHFKGDGPLGQVFAEGDSDGSVRGFVTNPQIHVPSRNGKLNVGGGVGNGVLSVATSLPDEKQPYTGTVDLQSGEIGEDIAYYLFQSQQVPSIVALGVFVEPDNSVTAAGGVIAQVLPGVTDETLAHLEEQMKKARNVTALIRDGKNVEDLVREYLGKVEFKKLPETSTLVYRCHCNVPRVERSLMLLGEKELTSMIDEKQASDIRCDFCGRHYEVTIERLEGLLALVRATKEEDAKRPLASKSKNKKTYDA